MRSIVALLCLLALTIAAPAATFNFASDLVSESNSVNGVNQFITVHPQWQPNGGGAAWISHTNSGYGGVILPNTSGYVTPTASFFEYIDLVDVIFHGGTVSVWADDTASVYLNGSLLYAANQVQDGACAAGPIGCQTSEGAVIALDASLFQQGQNVLRIDAFQRAGGPFGVLYTGSVEYSAIPEPGSMALIGGGLTLIAWYGRRRIRR